MRARMMAALLGALALACGSDESGASGGTAAAGGSAGSAAAGGNAGSAGSAAAGGAAGSGGAATGGNSGTSGSGGAAGSSVGGPRGYMTTPAELDAAKSRADQGIEPYASALADFASYAGNPTDWPHGSLDGPVTCGGASGGDPGDPAYIANSGGGPLVLAKAYMYRLTGDTAWAADARAKILDLVDTTGWGGQEFSGANQCILNLSWFIPRFIIAADLLEGFAGWSANDKRSFADWLVGEVYPKTAWASRRRANNWGSAGSYTSAMIADYVSFEPSRVLVDDQGTSLSPSEAYTVHLEHQLARMNASEAMDAQCPSWGIRDHGGIPEELRRGSSGCDASYIVDQDASYTYQLAHIQSLVAHAELAWRREDRSLFDNVTTSGLGSILQAIHFVIANPTQSWPWSRSQTPTLDVAYRYYRDSAVCTELVCSDPANRVTSVAGNRVMSFTALTHGFAPSEDPGPPPRAPRP